MRSGGCQGGRSGGVVSVPDPASVVSWYFRTEFSPEKFQRTLDCQKIPAIVLSLRVPRFCPGLFTSWINFALGADISEPFSAASDFFKSDKPTTTTHKSIQ